MVNNAIKTKNRIKISVDAKVKNQQKQVPVMFYKKSFLKYFAILTGKHLCWSLFLIKSQT